MEFVHKPYQPGTTIAAIATPPGEGGVAIVRISGDDAIAIAAKVFTGPVHTYKTHTVHFGQVVNSKGEHIDDALLLVMLGKRSFTGENTIEIHCHGGRLVTRRVLEAVLQAGAAPAKPGEFTFKAFMNGKMDLAQAEAVQELIAAKNEHALDAAENHLQGKLSEKILSFQQKMTEIAAILEAWVDFPEEGLEFSTIDEICTELEQLSQAMKKLISTFHDGKIVQEGISMCLIGCPNVGKSSLMNALLDKERAIVSPIPGTTRDILEDQMRISGLHFTLKDTAGIRKAEDLIEQEGVRRSKEAMQKADVILLVLDASKGVQEEDLYFMHEVPRGKTIAIWNKCDLKLTSPLPRLDFSHAVSVSAKMRSGLDDLLAKIDEIIWEKGHLSKDEILITNARHKDALENAVEACDKVIFGLKEGISPEFLTIEIRSCLTDLGTIIGVNITEEILSAIFSKFCLGK